MDWRKNTVESYLDHDWLAEQEGRLKDKEAFLNWRRQKAELLDHPSLYRFGRNLFKLPHFISKHQIFDQDCVEIGKADELSPGDQELLKGCLQDFIPWRKGPFRFFDTFIDAEWRSDFKWQRLAPFLPKLEKKIIADIGCNNGYYLARMLAANPKLLIGFEPVARYFFYLELLKRFSGRRELVFELSGVDEMQVYQGFFDVVFMLGILYHRRNPLQALEQIWQALRPDGHLVLETASIDSDGPYCLFPDRYMKAPGYWFLPSAQAVLNMLKRCGFYNIRLLYSYRLTTREQRKTDWINTQSLEDFLDPEDPAKTVEGHPGPLRQAFIAQKKS